MLIKLFTLKICESSGYTRRATFKERIEWLRKGCPLRDANVVARYIKIMRRRRLFDSIAEIQAK